MDNENSRKRRIDDEDWHNEERDAFDSEGSGVPIRGRKAGRRVSGVARLEKSLYNIAGNVPVMSMVLQRLTMKELLQAVDVSPFWLTCIYQELRQRIKDSPFLRLWSTEAFHQDFLWLNWDLHFHQQLLEGNVDVDQPRQKSVDAYQKRMRYFPDVEAIITIGSRAASGQIFHEDAKLPIRQDHLYFVDNTSIITTPDFSFTGQFDDLLTYNTIMVQSLFLPKSKDVAFKAWGLGMNVDNWDIEKIRETIEFPQEDVGPGLELQAVLCLHSTPGCPTTTFVDNFLANYKTVGLLSGFTEEVGTNRMTKGGAPVAVGMSVYAGAAARASIYKIDFEEENAEVVLKEMQEQAQTFANGFCFVCWHDTRPWEQENYEEEWAGYIRPEERLKPILQDLRHRMPRTPIVGVQSVPKITVKTVEASNTNVKDDSTKNLVFGFLLVTYNSHM